MRNFSHFLAKAIFRQKPVAAIAADLSRVNVDGPVFIGLKSVGEKSGVEVVIGHSADAAILPTGVQAVIEASISWND
jgi:hypothetical protein